MTTLVNGERAFHPHEATRYYMGVWGAGIFDSDDARDYAGDTTKSLIQAIEENLLVLASKPSADAIVMDSVALLSSLREAYRTMLSQKRVLRWKSNYLDWFDLEYPSMLTSAGDFTVFRAEREKWFEAAYKYALADDAIDDAIEEWLVKSRKR